MERKDLKNFFNRSTIYDDRARFCSFSTVELPVEVYACTYFTVRRTYVLAASDILYAGAADLLSDI
jgi:hypothetical protein